MATLTQAQRDSPDIAHAASVTFVVPAWNEELHLSRCLESIRRLHAPPGACVREVIVVDNQSTDQTPAIARRLGACVISVPPGRVSLARNAGARAATGDWIAFVDADCELPTDWLQRCADHLSDDHVVAAGGAAGPPPPAAGWVERSVHLLSQASAPSQPTAVRWLASFNILIRKAAFDRVGGFDDRLASCEDCELSYRLAESGQLIYDPRVESVHHGESKSLSELFRREAWRSHGNIRVALGRIGDWRNWASLALPPVLVGCLAAAIITAALALFGRSGWWPWSAGLLALATALSAGVLVRLARRVSLGALPQVVIVYWVFIAGRAAGLLLSMPRVARRKT